MVLQLHIWPFLDGSFFSLLLFAKMLSFAPVFFNRTATCYLLSVSFVVISLIWLGETHTLTRRDVIKQAPARYVLRSGAALLHAAAVRERGKAKEMAIRSNVFAFRSAFAVALALTAAFVPARVSADSTKTVELDIRPGGTVHSFSEKIVRNLSFILTICTVFWSTLNAVKLNPRLFTGS